MITLDIETYDPLLLSFGPSAIKGLGELLTVALKKDDERTAVYELAHWTGKVRFENNTLIPSFKKAEGRSAIIQLLKKTLASREAKVGANLQYELCWFQHTENIWNMQAHLDTVGKSWQTASLFYDVQVTEAVLRGSTRNSLSMLSLKYGLDEKPIKELTEAVLDRLTELAAVKPEAQKYITALSKAIQKNGGKAAKGKNVKYVTDVRAYLWLLTREEDTLGRALLKEYNRHDVDVTHGVHLAQRESFAERWDVPAHQIETWLVPIIALMVGRGVKYSPEALKALACETDSLLKKINGEIERICGKPIPDSYDNETKKLLGEILNTPVSEKTGIPLLNKALLGQTEHPLAALLTDRANVLKTRDTFIQSILRASHNGRVYPRIFQIGMESGGTKTGRLSYQGLNLQNQPKPKDLEDVHPLSPKVLTHLIRQVFLPDENQRLVSADYGGQEPRLQLEVALLRNAPGAYELLQAYLENPELSLHDYVKDVCNEALVSFGQKPFMKKAHAKPINLGIPYGSGAAKVKAQIPGPPEVGELVYNTYVEKFPVLLWCRDLHQAEAAREGVCYTILGRACQFDNWKVDLFRMRKVNRWTDEEYRKAKESAMGTYSASLADVKHKYPGKLYCRDKTHAGFNGVVQGSASDQTKLAMVRAYYLYQTLPLIQVHDELLFSLDTRLAEDGQALGKFINSVMNKAVKLHVPIVTEYEVYVAGWASEVLYSKNVTTLPSEAYHVAAPQ